MFCYICGINITCLCNKESDQGLELIDLTCAIKNGYPRISLFPCDYHISEIHICSQVCQNDLYKEMLINYKPIV